MIKKQEADSSGRFKKGLGYIQIKVNSISNQDTLISYYLSPRYSFITEQALNDAYPNFYTYVGNRLVIIYIDALKNLYNDQYTDDAKKAIRKLIDKFVDKPQKRTFYDSNNKKALQTRILE